MCSAANPSGMTARARHKGSHACLALGKSRWRSARAGPAWFLASLAVATAAVLGRGYPTTVSDAGIFLSVAGRLLAGDRLYRDAFDNKDPLFYYVEASAVWLFGWRGPFLFDIAWLVIGSVGTHLLLRAVTGDFVLAVFGQLLYPLLLTQINYYSGFSETPGLSLLPLFAYFVYVHRPKLAGCLAAAIFFLKVTVLPIAIAIAIVELGLAPSKTSRRRAHDALAFVATMTATGAAIFLVLVLRGEAGAYVASVHENTTYASYALRVEGWSSGTGGHLRVVEHFLPNLMRDLAATLLALVAALFATSGEVRANLSCSRLLVLSLVASLSTLLVLAETALWDHHLQLLAFPLLCTAALALACVRTAARRHFHSLDLLQKLAVFLVAGGCLIAAGWPQHTMANLRRWTEPPQTSVSDALRRAVRPAHSRALQVAYAHLGTNDEHGAGAFLSSSFRLACPRFHQYPFNPSRVLNQTIQCLHRQSLLLVAVTPTFTIDSYTYWRRGTPLPWQRFVRAGATYLRSHCQLVGARSDVRVYRCRNG